MFARIKVENAISKTLAVLRAIIAFISTNRWQILVSIATFLVFSAPPQVHEIYRIYAEQHPLSPYIFLFTVGITVLELTLWNNILQRLSEPGDQSRLRVCRLATALAAIAPGLGAVIGLGAALPEKAFDPYVALTLNALRVVLAMACLLLFLIVLRASAAKGPKVLRTTDVVRRILFIFSLLLSLPIFFAQTWIVSAYGTMLIVIIFFIMLSCTLSYLTSFSLKSQLPLTGMLIVLSLGFSAFDLNNNHDIRLLHTAGAPLPAAHAFTRWLDGRADFEAYKASGRQYPVFIVIAEGGGIYAANHAAMFLSRMQDICPNFAQHLFVISAVSGGSLGAGLFAALARDSATNAGPKPCASSWDQPGPVEVLSRKALDRDFLAPLVGAAVFPDFLQYFLPFPIESFDRAKTAEQSFEDMRAAISEEDHAMADDFLSLWEPDGAQPALLLNVTRVETGGRSEISHIDLGDGLFNNGLMFNQDSGQLLYSVRLSTAIGLSARFPWITPAGRLNPALPSNVVGFGTANFVDGGYYDNSGADAVLDLIEAMRYSLAYASVDLRVIVLKHLAPSENDAAGYDMFMPIRAMLNSRSERARSSAWRLVQTLCPTHDQCDHVAPLDQKVWYSYLEGDGYDLPLGWLFSTQSANAVSRIIGRPQDCPQDDYGNGCLIVHVRNLLQPPAAQ